MPDFQADIRYMTNRQLVAAWNVMQFSRRMAGEGPHENEPLIDAELTRRGIVHKVGSKTKRRSLRSMMMGGSR